jgi:sugar lactone lactonase YvrE
LGTDAAMTPKALKAPTWVRTIGQTGQAIMYPSGLAVDSAGSIFVADTGNDRVEMYAAGSTTPTWSIGTRGLPFGGAIPSFENPRDVAVDASFVYVADTDNGVIQILHKSDGTFVGVIPFKFNTPIGVSVGSDGAGNERILVSDGGTGNVVVFDTNYTPRLTIPPTKRTEGTRDAATDSHGNIYTADYRGGQVDKYSPTGGLILQWGGTGSIGCQLVPKPYGVDVDSSDHVYVASSDLEVIKEFNPDGSCVNAFGQSGKGSTQLFQLRRVAVGAGANPLVYAADLWGLKIVAYNQDGTISSTQPELGSIGVYPPAGGLNETSSVAVNGTYVYVTDTVNQRMQRFNLDGSNPLAWGTKGVQESTASFNWAQGVGVDPSGNVWVANTRNNRIDEFGPDGTGPIRSIGNRTGGGSITFNWPMAVFFDPAGHMYVADTFNGRIQAFTVTPTAVTPLWSKGVPGSGTGQFAKPWDVTFDGTGASPRLLVADSANSRIVALDPATGNWLGVLPISKGKQAGQVTKPEGIAVAANGSIWIADTNNNRIEEFNNDGSYANVLLGGYGTGNGQFNLPKAIRVGPDRLLYVADDSNNRVQVFQQV